MEDSYVHLHESECNLGGGGGGGGALASARVSIFSSLLSLAESVSDDCLYTSFPHHAGSHHFVRNSHVRIFVATNSQYMLP